MRKVVSASEPVVTLDKADKRKLIAISAISGVGVVVFYGNVFIQWSNGTKSADFATIQSLMKFVEDNDHNDITIYEL